MRQAIVKIMLLNLLRDRATLAMSFLLPGIVFAIFAVIFAGASGGELAVRVAVLDQRADAASRELSRKSISDREAKTCCVRDEHRERAR